MFNPKRRLSHSVNYKTCCYANLADVTKNFVCWSDILTHDHLSIIKVSNSFTFVSPNKSLSSFLLSNTGSFFIAVLMYERWKVKKELCSYIAWPILIHTVVSSTNHFIIVYFQMEAHFQPLIWNTNNGKSKRIMAGHCTSDITTVVSWMSYFVMVTFKQRLNFHCYYMNLTYAFNSKKQVSKGDHTRTF